MSILNKLTFQTFLCSVELDSQFPTINVTKMAKMPFIPDPRCEYENY